MSQFTLALFVGVCVYYAFEFMFWLAGLAAKRWLNR
jgi:hypothetical protein